MRPFSLCRRVSGRVFLDVTQDTPAQYSEHLLTLAEHVVGFLDMHTQSTSLSTAQNCNPDLPRVHQLKQAFHQALHIVHSWEVYLRFGLPRGPTEFCSQ